jgi:hypothetical protein
VCEEGVRRRVDVVEGELDADADEPAALGDWGIGGIGGLGHWGIGAYHTEIALSRKRIIHSAPLAEPALPMMCMSCAGSWMVNECMAVSERRKPST